ncbi:MAG: hypothetical protein ACK40D_05690 [Cyanobacteriota bacterium]|jgi:hypothetical protein
MGCELRHAYAIRAREHTTWSYADVAAVMGHSPEVHRRTYLREISGEQTKAAVVRRLLGGGEGGLRFRREPWGGEDSENTFQVGYEKARGAPLGALGCACPHGVKKFSR